MQTAGGVRCFQPTPCTGAWLADTHLVHAILADVLLHSLLDVLQLLDPLLEILYLGISSLLRCLLLLDLLLRPLALLVVLLRTQGLWLGISIHKPCAYILFPINHCRPGGFESRSLSDMRS